MNQQASNDQRVYSDADDHNDHTRMSLYSFYGDVSGDRIHILMEAPFGISKLGRLYKPSYVFNILC